MLYHLRHPPIVVAHQGVETLSLHRDMGSVSFRQYVLTQKRIAATMASYGYAQKQPGQAQH